MIAELGHFALILALAVALVQSIVPLIGAQRGWSGWMAVGEPAATAQFLLIALSFGAITTTGIFSSTKANGPCFSSPAGYASAWI